MLGLEGGLDCTLAEIAEAQNLMERKDAACVAMLTGNTLDDGARAVGTDLATVLLWVRESQGTLLLRESSTERRVR